MAEPPTELEEVKRLTPTTDTLRELFLKSGNYCMFPGCTRRMMTHSGEFIGQVCHIEAASEGGERFNPAQSNEDRRKFENLMLMCYEHHIKTNDVAQFPVSTLQGYKRRHEEHFTDVGRTMMIKPVAPVLVDRTTLVQPTVPDGAAQFHKIMGYPEDSESMQAFQDAAERLAYFPVQIRVVFTTMVEKADHKGAFNPELIRMCFGDEHDMPVGKFVTLLAPLEEHRFISETDPDDFEQRRYAVRGIGEWREFWIDLKKFSKRAGISLKTFIVDLDFSSIGIEPEGKPPQ